VTLGARASVWFNTVIRGDSAPVSVGDDSNVQDNSVVHEDEGYPAVIGARVTVGHRAIVHGCVIEDDCLIGMGAVILTGARIGRGSLIGAAALVREGQDIPPGSLALGAPARVTGPVNDGHRDAIRRGAEHYVELSRSYLARGFARPHPARAADTGTTRDDGGPMTFVEWERLVTVLEQGPARVGRMFEGISRERMAVAPAPQRWSALEVLCHLRDADCDVLVPRLGQMLAEDGARIENVDMTDWLSARAYAAQDPDAALATWRRARAGAVQVLETLGPVEWSRLGFHSVRGPYPLADMVRYWAEHDLSHRRQIAEALHGT